MTNAAPDRTGADSAAPDSTGASAADPAVASGALLTPLNLGRRTLPNRIVFGTHLTNFGHDNAFSPRHLAYYEARAAGGAALLVTEALTVHPQDWPYEHVPFGHREEIVPSLTVLAERVRRANGQALLLAGLNHTGGQCSGKLLRQSPWAPSAGMDAASKRVSRTLSVGEIAEVVAGFGATAARVRRAGLDGVEVQAGQYALLRQFLSPLTNHRHDAYGGDLEGRMRALVEVLRAVREALGADGLLGLKLCGDELAPWGGLTPDDAVAIAQRLAALGTDRPDYLSIQIGGPYTPHVTEAAMPTPQGHAAHLAATVRKSLREGSGAALPVFAEGRIESPALAAALLGATTADAQADAVVMTRALISDPNLPAKVAGMLAEPVRPHIGMTRYFSVLGDWNRPLSDLANPRAGREDLLPAVGPAVRPTAALSRTGQRTARGVGGTTGSAVLPGPMLVVGGGVAGMEAALTLGQLGHRVVLREAGPRLGGMAALLAESVPARAEFALLVDYYRTRLRQVGVEVRLESPLSADEAGLEAELEAELEDYAAIYLATGAEPPAELLPAWVGVPVVSPRQLLAGSTAGLLPPTHAGRAAVVDTEYGFRMGNAVEWLLAQGYGVDVISEDFFVGRALIESAEFLWFNRVAEQGARLHPRLSAEAWAAGVLTCRDRFSGRVQHLENIALVVAATPEAPRDALLAQLRARHPRVSTLGDARAPRLMGEAIQHAHRCVLEDRVLPTSAATR